MIQPDRIETLYLRARRAGRTMLSLCTEQGIAPSTPSRWRAGAEPKEETILRIENALDAIERERA